MANSGYKGYEMLEQYNSLTGEATGVTKTNSESDPDYVAPVWDPHTCEINDTSAPWFDTTDFNGTGGFNVFERERTDYTVKIDWNPAYDNVGVIGYKIECDNRTWHVDNYPREFTITGLEPGTQYTVSVTAKDAAGNYRQMIGKQSEVSTTIETTGVNYSISTNTNEVWVPAQGGNGFVSVTANGDWTYDGRGITANPSTGESGTTFVTLNKAIANAGNTVITTRVWFRMDGDVNTSTFVDVKQYAGGDGPILQG